MAAATSSSNSPPPEGSSYASLLQAEQLAVAAYEKEASTEQVDKEPYRVGPEVVGHGDGLYAGTNGDVIHLHCIALGCGYTPSSGAIWNVYLYLSDGGEKGCITHCTWGKSDGKGMATIGSMLRILNKCIDHGSAMFEEKYHFHSRLPEVLQIRKKQTEKLEALAQAARVAQTARQHHELRAMHLEEVFIKDIAGLVEEYVVDELIGGGNPPPIYGQRGTKRKAESPPLP